MREMKLQELKTKTPAELVSFAEELEVENASTMRKQELMFGILKRSPRADRYCRGGRRRCCRIFGFCARQANYLRGRTTSTSPSQIRRFGLRTGDTIDGHTQPKKANATLPCSESLAQFRRPEGRHKVNFDNLTPLYPDEWLKMESRTRPRRTSPPASSTSSPGRQGPARADRVAAAPARPCCCRTSPTRSRTTIRVLPDRAPHRRAAGEVTDMQRSVKGEVISSTFDGRRCATSGRRDGDREAKRLVEHGRDVVILLDSIRGSARLQHRGAVVRQGAHRRRRRQRAAAAEALFGAARNIEEDGSLTVIATALIDTAAVWTR
jgi:transcription termination factor Rho